MLNFRLLTLESNVLLEKLTGSYAVKKFLAFYGTQMFITAFIRARHLFLFLKINLNIIFLSTTGFSKWSLSLPVYYRSHNLNPEDIHKNRRSKQLH
jgi:hypothetical protein